MKEEEGVASSCYISRKDGNKNLCISGEDANHSGDESGGIVIQADTRMEREIVRKYWAEGESEMRIACIMGLHMQEVHAYIYKNTVSRSAITNEQILSRELCARVKTEDEIAGILDVTVQEVCAYLERKR